MPQRQLSIGTIITIGLILGLSLAFADSLAAGQTVTSTGSVTAIGIGVYSDNPPTVKLTSINWGVIDKGTDSIRIVYLLNSGNKDVNLTMTTTGWNYTTGLSCTWNMENTTLQPNTVIAANVQLHVDQSAVSGANFAFNITFTGTQI